MDGYLIYFLDTLLNIIIHILKIKFYIIKLNVICITTLVKINFIYYIVLYHHLFYSRKAKNIKNFYSITLPIIKNKILHRKLNVILYTL